MATPGKKVHGGSTLARGGGGGGGVGGFGVPGKEPSLTSKPILFTSLKPSTREQKRKKGGEKRGRLSGFTAADLDQDIVVCRGRREALSNLRARLFNGGSLKKIEDGGGRAYPQRKALFALFPGTGIWGKKVQRSASRSQQQKGKKTTSTEQRPSLPLERYLAQTAHVFGDSPKPWKKKKKAYRRDKGVVEFQLTNKKEGNSIFTKGRRIARGRSGLYVGEIGASEKRGVMFTV